jgi:hypothetical protein
MRSEIRLKTIVLLSLLLLVMILRVSGKDPQSNHGHEKPIDFTFARVQFNSFFYGFWMPGWAQDYPRSERNFLKILSEVTGIKTNSESYSVVRLDEPEIMQYPVLYFSEPGSWDITAAESTNFREYLLRGGFAIFDDFDGPRDWFNFQRCMKQVFPEHNLTKLTLDHPIFHCFFDIETLDMMPPAYIRGKPVFYGLSGEDGRLHVVANFNNDIGDFWEWSDESFYPISLSNEAYKFGVNYVIYALTH